jgi:ketosteroid isomerase-like protein
MINKKCLTAIGAAALLLGGCNQSAPALNDDAMKMLTEVHDRQAIEKLLLDYYSHLGSGSGKGFGAFFTEDAVLDINGIILKGHAEIQKIYDDSSAGKEKKELPWEQLHVDYMHVTNMNITVNGDTATARMFWTGIVSDHVNKPPQFEEMGREYDLLVKRDGKWLIQKRVIIADAGMPVGHNKTYKRALDYDITKAD